MRNIRIRGDRVIMFIAIILGAISVIAVFSSGSFLAKDNPDIMGKTHVLKSQIKFFGLGLAALLACYALSVEQYRKLAPVVFVGAGLLLIMLFIPAFQDTRNGAVRGIKIGSQTLQVFEVLKVGVIFYMSWALEKFEDKFGSFKSFALYILVPLGLVCLLVMMNSFSSALLLGLISVLLMYFMKVSWKNLIITGAIVVSLVALLFCTYHLSVAIYPDARDWGIFNRIATVESRLGIGEKDYVLTEGDAGQLSAADKEKVLAELDHERQSVNAKIAIAEGGILGKGVGRGSARHALSMAFSDFIFASIVEETGLFGGVIIILLYLIFLFRCISISIRCPDNFSQALALGIGFLITIQAFLHILVNVRILPITGHTLPLISHGGTAFIVLSGAIGIVLSISRNVNRIEAEHRAEAALAETEANELLEDEAPAEPAYTYTDTSEEIEL
ncbi:MAG: FtsW/RodA/SpoVE family cell cycle protein [Bacteroidales bacterium]|nr:FtsW/RodA/SpoVE family cell cycle protein [Bacteroidales bacterium]